MLEFFYEMYKQRGHGLLQHALAVARVTRAVMSELGVGNDTNLTVAAFLHDVGKTRWPDELFIKKELTVKDRRYIEQHPILGVGIIQSIWPNVSKRILDVVAQHHERPGGQGYPCRVFYPSYYSQVVAAVDVYCAMQEPRPYRNRVATPQEALEAIRPWAPAEVVRALEKLQYDSLTVLA